MHKAVKEHSERQNLHLVLMTVPHVKKSSTVHAQCNVRAHVCIGIDYVHQMVYLTFKNRNKGMHTLEVLLQHLFSKIMDQLTDVL